MNSDKPVYCGLRDVFMLFLRKIGFAWFAFVAFGAVTPMAHSIGAEKQTDNVKDKYTLSTYTQPLFQVSAASGD